MSNDIQTTQPQRALPYFIMPREMEDVIRKVFRLKGMPLLSDTENVRSIFNVILEVAKLVLTEEYKRLLPVTILIGIHQLFSFIAKYKSSPIAIVMNIPNDIIILEQQNVLDCLTKILSYFNLILERRKCNDGR